MVNLQLICCHTPDRNYSKEFNGENCIQIRLKVKPVIILGHHVLVTFAPYLTPVILETTRATKM